MGSPSLKDLRFIAKKALKRNIFRKIQEIKERDEQRILFEYSIKSALELKYAELRDLVEKKEKQKKDVFIPRTRMSLLHSKIHLLNATHSKSDFKIIEKMFKEIGRDIKNV